MRILHVLDHSIPLHSGYTFRTRAILEEQRKRGWQTFHITGPKHTVANAPKEEIDGLTFFRSQNLGAVSGRIPVFNQISAGQRLTQRLAEVVEQVRPDIVHAHSPALNGLAALRVAKPLKIPVVYEVRAFWEDAAVDHGTSRFGGVRYRLTRALETYVLRKANAVTTICQGLKSDIISRGIGEAKVTVVPNAVDPDRFAIETQPSPELIRKLGLEGKRVLGFIGSFYAYEGIDLLLHALPGIAERIPNIYVLLVGGGPREAYLRQLAAELNLNDRVIFTGRVAHNRVPDYYGLVDVLVYPRMSMRLTELVTPLKPLEAMAQGRLVLASDVGGHRELIAPGVTGELFPAGNKVALADAVIGLFERESEWPNLRQTARRFVEDERTWAISVKNYAPIYMKLCDDAGATPSREKSVGAV